MRRLPSLAALVVVWLLLWESASPANLLSGLVVSAVLLGLFPVRGDDAPAGRLRPIATLSFLGYFVTKLVEASLIVAWEVVTPRERINQGIVAVPIHGVSPGLITLVANAISLTPGTLTLEVDREPTTVLYVHVLHLHDIDAVRRDVRDLERRAIRAFGSDDAVRLVETSETPGEPPVEPTREVAE